MYKPYLQNVNFFLVKYKQRSNELVCKRDNYTISQMVKKIKY